jgi:ADP-heptose:LPS heptosyltransferase
MDGLQQSVLAGAQRVLLFRALQLGDLLCAVPALRSLRRALPYAHIALLSLPWARDFVDRYSAYLDEFIEFPGFPGLPERQVDTTAIPSFLDRMREKRFDLTIQMHGSGGIVNVLLAQFGAKAEAGYCESAEGCPDPARFLPYPHGIHEVHRHLRLVEFLGASSKGDDLEFPLRDRDYEELARVPESASLRGGQYVCLHAGARFLTRRYPVSRLAEVGDYFAMQGYTVVLTGSSSERELTQFVASAMRFPSINLAGLTTLGAAAALVAGACIVITNDTGMSHLAAAVRVPSVVIVLSSDAARWAPLNKRLHPTILAEVACRPCEYRVCPIGFPCADQIPSSAVVQCAERLLNEQPTAQAPHPLVSAAYRKETSCAGYAS